MLTCVSIILFKPPSPPPPRSSKYDPTNIWGTNMIKGTEKKGGNAVKTLIK